MKPTENNDLKFFINTRKTANGATLMCSTIGCFICTKRGCNIACYWLFNRYKASTNIKQLPVSVKFSES